MVRRRKQDRSLFEVLLPDSDKLWPDWLKRIDGRAAPGGAVPPRRAAGRPNGRWPRDPVSGRSLTPSMS
ncbi:MAG TPA: hypothetical protein VH679_10250, partial [Vicinamibacterales bacterium]